MEENGQLHVLAAEPQGTQWVGAWVDPRTALDSFEYRSTCRGWHSDHVQSDVQPTASSLNKYLTHRCRGHCLGSCGRPCTRSLRISLQWEITWPCIVCDVILWNALNAVCVTLRRNKAVISQENAYTGKERKKLAKFYLFTYDLHNATFNSSD
jgi:hypothetical protein